jgi:hypothetical protein
MEAFTMTIYFNKLKTALNDLIDGEQSHDLVDAIGLPIERCQEIVNLSSNTPTFNITEDDLEIALIDVADGEQAHDLVGSTGLDLARCQEISDLCSEVISKRKKLNLIR